MSGTGLTGTGSADGEFVYVDEAVPGVRWDAKYATWDNFTGQPVDGYPINRIAGTRALCTALEQARDEAASRGLGLLLWDGYRPRRAVDAFLRWAAEPEDGRTQARHHPRLTRRQIVARGYVAAPSGHSSGSAVDLTLFDLATGALLPMGGDHDLMDAVSHHGAAGIPAEATRNRRELRALLEDCGFRAYEQEWWHYGLRDEPHPGRFFDFPLSELPRMPQEAAR